ncbi:tryptophan-rich sensory protein [Pacificimonas sp. WHA3]|uniref:Tryptophan-rich sensory protein n=1 Tax=Pacificimonas pallii TaxID=2827236 RepID=A0ABS6SE71_9SPHN|nr:TspO/MBR family protein [Pacificimonas pallii]MBV7256718.1 tryptophan-rich sensory protein [Pacificimonas pallii]
MTDRSRDRRAALIGVLIVAVLGLGVNRLLLPGGTGEWYLSLVKPDLNPPSWLFGVVWPILYILIGAAGGLIWKASFNRARFWYILQLALNLLWSPVFFGMQRVDIGLGVIAALNIAAIIATIRMAAVRRLAAWLMVPYLIWIAFAAILNLRIWQLNG